ncbi:iron complex transport system permease protein [Mycolicibacterium mucogenicum 261Sha1.1M5]|uniref:FecCD family ABC transporter permease n=1 Tax=Leucobacter aridicollis TaxID=283878 RepID=UPI000EB0375A|nr:iron chelate uptake ABC transporter family permease subunit [Leucobacter aridicollis]MCS3427126.1 iron complex transport system permease protein [Leucobacter aridicollis]RKQ85188.1 iron complex transport system permease protein [Mycolicibacterium mucogenicum 261Sha1.1M5]
MTSPVHTENAARPLRAKGHATQRRLLGIAALIAALCLVLVLSITYGANPVPMSEVWRTVFDSDGSEASSIVWTLRAPRTLVGIVAGAAFGVAGALIQAITRNPLADPGILGVNAGAGFAITVGVAVFGVTGIAGYVWFSFAGAVLATVLVYLIGASGRGSASPVTLVIAGVALAAVLTAFATFLQLINEETFRSFRNWSLGSLARVSVSDTLTVLPLIVLGLVLAVVISGSLNAVALGDDQAASLGANIARTRTIGLISVTLLAGAATALTGGIAFVGLAVPHLVRWFTGPDQRWIVAYTALASPVLVLSADVLGRVVARPGEIEAGVMTAVLGAPVLIALVRRRKASTL